MHHSLYLHIPFCVHRCAYCDFNTYAGHEGLIEPYAAAVRKELQHVGSGAPKSLEVHTVFFGGGTPSLLDAGQLQSILDAARSHFRIDSEAEITIEANPGTLSERALHELRRAGFNRLSLGVQSANGEELRLLERTHDFGDALQAIAAARRAGFDNLNTDLIFGLPGQEMSAWRRTVERVLQVDPTHISAYALTVERATPLGHWVGRGLMPGVEEDLQAEMYEWVSAELEREGYLQYEISNWAREGMKCRHNMQYWRGAPYLGFGAGAHGYAEGWRYSNVLSIQEYIARLEGGGLPSPLYALGPAMAASHEQSRKDEMTDFMIAGLRLTEEGVFSAKFERRFGCSIESTYGSVIQPLVISGLLEWYEGSPSAPLRMRRPAGRGAADGLRLTARGRLLGNRVFSEFVN